MSELHTLKDKEGNQYKLIEHDIVNCKQCEYPRDECDIFQSAPKCVTRSQGGVYEYGGIWKKIKQQ